MVVPGSICWLDAIALLNRISHVFLDSWLYPSKNHPDLLELEIKTIRVGVVTQDRTTDWVEAEVYGSFKDHTMLSEILLEN